MNINSVDSNWFVDGELYFMLPQQGDLGHIVERKVNILINICTLNIDMYLESFTSLHLNKIVH